VTFDEAQMKGSKLTVSKYDTTHPERSAFNVLVNTTELLDALMRHSEAEQAEQKQYATATATAATISSTSSASLLNKLAPCIDPPHQRLQCPSW
jgi:hypothetical protein